MIAAEEQPDAGTLRVGDTVELAYVDQSRGGLVGESTVWKEISGGLDTIQLGSREVNSRQYVSWFNFRGGDQQKLVRDLSGGERNRVHLAKLLRAGGNVLLLDEPTNDLDVDTLRALEDALLDFAGCAVVISHDRWFLDRVATHILGLRGRLADDVVRGVVGRLRRLGARDARAGGAGAAPDPVQAASFAPAEARESRHAPRHDRDPGSGLSDREAPDDPRPVPAVAERAPAGVQPVDEPRAGRRLRRGDDPGAITRLGHRSWVRLASGAGDRVAKYEHLLDDELTLSLSELALLAVLMLRGPQTPGELKTRSERLYPLGSLADVLAVLERLIERRLVARLDRRPGQKEERYVQLIGGAPGEDASELAPAARAAATGRGRTCGRTVGRSRGVARGARRPPGGRACSPSSGAWRAS